MGLWGGGRRDSTEERGRWWFFLFFTSGITHKDRKVLYKDEKSAGGA